MGYEMHNETEFVFEDVLEDGFTTVPNPIFNHKLSYKAIGLYASILKVKNIPGWKIYQSTLVTEKDGKSSISSAMKELIEAGFIKKINLRDTKGRITGVAYKVYCAPKTDFPTSDNQKSEKPKSDNQPLKNKDIKKERYNKLNINNISKDILSSTDIKNIITTWNSISDVSEIKFINPSTNRYKLLKARVNEYGLDNVIEAINNINKSTFLRGGNNRGWIITFDWLIKPNNFPKVLEGNYSDKEGERNGLHQNNSTNPAKTENPKYDFSCFD